MSNNKSIHPRDIRLFKHGIYIRRHGAEKKRIADPILVTAFATNNEDTQREQALVVIRFRNRRGKWKNETISASLLTGPNRDFVELLSNRGYLWPPDRALWPKTIAALSMVKPSHHIHAVDVPGWHADAYVLPGEAYTPRGPDRRAFLIRPNPTIKLGRFRRSGSLAQWQKIAKLCCHSSRARCAMAAAFAAPNLRPLNIPSFGLNFSGETTTGKSLSIVLAASVPGLNSNEGPDSWDGTAAAYEQRALGHRDCIMPLDELGHIVGEPSEVAKLVTFRLASNRPKAKAGQYIAANNLIDGEFRVIALSTSEHPIWQHLDGEQYRGPRVRGEQVRMINLRAGVSKCGDVFDGPKAARRVGKAVEGRARTIEKYARRAIQCQGEAYRAYLGKRAADKAAVRRLRAYIADYQAAGPLPLQHRWLRRIARYFSAIYASAALAIDYGVLPWSKKATLADIRTCMRDAMGQLIANFEPRSDGGIAPDQRDDEDFKQFKKRVASASFVSLDRGARTNRALVKKLKAADGIVRRDKSGTKRAYLFRKTFERWYVDRRSRRRLTQYLRTQHIFGEGRRPDTCTREISIAALGGKVACYALSRRRLRRTRERGDSLGGGDRGRCVAKGR